MFIERDSLDPADLRKAISATFHTRNTHPVPDPLPSPPAAWAKDFPEMATEAGLSTSDYLVAFGLLEQFWAAHGLSG